MGLLSDEHFTVDGTLIEAWALHKSFRLRDDKADRNGGNFHATTMVASPGLRELIYVDESQRTLAAASAGDCSTSLLEPNLCLSMIRVCAFREVASVPGESSCHQFQY